MSYFECLWHFENEIWSFLLGTSLNLLMFLFNRGLRALLFFSSNIKTRDELQHTRAHTKTAFGLWLFVDVSGRAPLTSIGAWHMSLFHFFFFLFIERQFLARFVTFEFWPFAICRIRPCSVFSLCVWRPNSSSFLFSFPFFFFIFSNTITAKVEGVTSWACFLLKERIQMHAHA